MAPGLPLALALLAALTIVRLIGLHLSTVDLYVDESQYWGWSREFAFGYFSKLLLIAWTIRLATAICGDGEACVRSAAPLFYFGTSLLAFAIARALYDETTAFLAAVLTALAPGVAFSARIISTDVPLLFFWALALLAYVRLLKGGGWHSAITLGIAFGLGLLAKYAMAYFALSVAVAALVDADARRLLRSRKLWAAAIVGLLVAAPNLIWNARNGFLTFAHTGDNISGGGMVFDARNGLAFLWQPVRGRRTCCVRDPAPPRIRDRAVAAHRLRPADAGLRAAGHGAPDGAFLRHQGERQLGGAGLRLQLRGAAAASSSGPGAAG